MPAYLTSEFLPSLYFPDPNTLILNPCRFSYHDFNATITLSRWNIRRMPGNATFFTQLQLTKGVVISVKGPPQNKTANETPVFFNGTAISDE